MLHVDATSHEVAFNGPPRTISSIGATWDFECTCQRCPTNLLPKTHDDAKAEIRASVRGSVFFFVFNSLALLLGAHQEGHATARFLEGFLEGSLKEVLLRRVLKRHLVRISVATEVLRRVLRRERFIEALRRCLEGRNTSFCRVRPLSRAPYFKPRIVPKNPLLGATLKGGPARIPTQKVGTLQKRRR